MRPRKKEREGDFIQAEIAPDAFVYCRLVDHAYLFHHFLTNAPLADFEVLANKPFIVGLYVMLYATREGRWKIVEAGPVTPELLAVAAQPGLVRSGVNSPMTAEHTLRELFGITGFEKLNPNFPWQEADLHK